MTKASYVDIDDEGWRSTPMPSGADNYRYIGLDQKHCTATEWSFERQGSNLVVVLMLMCRRRWEWQTNTKDDWLVGRCIPCTLSPLLYMHAAMRRIPVIGGGELSLLSQPWLHSFTDIHHLFDMSVLLSPAGLVLLFRACPGLMMTFLV
jgi:hypothetical protein